MGKAPGAVADPSCCHHLEGQPGPNPTGDECRGEYRERAEQEAKVTPEHVPGGEEKKEHWFETCRPPRGESKSGSACSEHAEHCHAFCVHTARAELTEHSDEQKREKHGDYPRSVADVCLVYRRVRRNEQRPKERDRTEEGARSRSPRRRTGRDPPGERTGPPSLLVRVSLRQLAQGDCDLVDCQPLCRRKDSGDLRGEPS